MSDDKIIELENTQGTEDVNNVPEEEARVFKLEELVLMTTEYLEQKRSIDELNEEAKQMTIRQYIPMMDKLRLMMGIIFNMQSSELETEEVRAIAMERDLFFNVLLGTYANVDVSNEELKTYKTYDLLYPFFGAYLLQFCRADYDKFVELLEKSVNFYNIKDMLHAMETLDYKRLEKAAEDNRKLLADLEHSRELIGELKEIYGLANPQAKQVVAELEKVALKEIEESPYAVDGVEAMKKTSVSNTENEPETVEETEDNSSETESAPFVDQPEKTTGEKVLDRMGIEKHGKGKNVKPRIKKEEKSPSKEPTILKI